MVMDDFEAAQESHNDPKALILHYFGGRLLELTASLRPPDALQADKQLCNHLKIWQHLTNAS